MPIPRVIHIVWIGDQSKRPDRFIESWRKLNPTFQVHLWGNDDLRNHAWWLGAQMASWLSQEICGAADLMRWEILSRYGGIAFDADSYCVRRLEDWLLEPDCFATWENEIVRPGLISNGALGCAPKHPLFGQIIADILRDKDILSGPAWQKVGPGRITDTVRKHSYIDITIYPSHYFIPDHHTGLRYKGAGPVFARQEWGSTRGTYGLIGIDEVGVSA